MKKKLRKLKLTLNNILVLFILIGSIFSMHAQCTKPGWNHQSKIEIDNSAITENLVDYAVQVVFDSRPLITAGQMLPDGADIRVSSNCDGSLPLEFWFDNINEENTKIWVKMSSLTMGVNENVYVHYGNATAVSESNAQQVFLYHADFNTGDLSDWSFDPDGGTWALDTVDSENVMSCTSPPSGNGTMALLNSNLPEEDYVVEMEIYAQADGNMGGVVFEFDDFDNYSSYHLMTGADVTMSSIITNNVPNYSLTEPFISEPQVWYDWSVSRSKSTDEVFISLDGQLQRTIPSYFGKGIGLWAFGGGVIYFDNLFVRKYTEVPPIVTVVDGFTLGGDDFSLNKFKIYPNPVNNVLQVSSLTKFKSFKIVDMHGRVQLSSNLSSEQSSIDVSKLSSGIYILNLFSMEKTHSIMKLIKE